MKSKKIPEQEKAIRWNPRLIYVAGPYRAKDEEGVSTNVINAENVGIACANRGWYPVIPHCNTFGFEHLVDMPAHVWDRFCLEGTISLMFKCHAVVMVPGWRKSIGASDEYRTARDHGIPVYKKVSDVPNLNTVSGQAAWKLKK